MNYYRDPAHVAEMKELEKEPWAQRMEQDLRRRRAVYNWRVAIEDERRLARDATAAFAAQQDRRARRRWWIIAGACAVGVALPWVLVWLGGAP